jgi:hypothetical protein
MAKAKKLSKPRKNKYAEKVKVDATFDELLGALFPKPPDSLLPKKALAKKSPNKKK